MSDSHSPAGSRSHELFVAARQLLPGGVDSPVRAFGAVGGEPFFVARGQGARLTDVDGRGYLDYVMSWGPLIAGHAHPHILARVGERLAAGTSYGAPVELEVLMAQAVHRFVPSMEMLRFTCSGTEAAMSVVRLARAATGRDRLIKCDGCYHGHFDALLVKAGSGLATQGLADSAGVPASLAALTTVVPYNDLAAVEAALKAHPGEYAALLVEPVAANMGLVPPRPGYLDGLRKLATAHGALLVFDEVISGFRLAKGGAQEHYGVTPDLTVLGKIIGGGLPVGAYGGPRKYMEMIAPLGPVYQAGTLSGNPLAMAGGLATLELLDEPGVYAALADKGAALAAGLRAEIARRPRAAAALSVVQLGSLLTVFCATGEIANYEDARRADRELFRKLHGAMLARGVFLPPSQFEAWFLSTAHTAADIHETVAAFGAALDEILPG